MERPLIEITIGKRVKQIREKKLVDLTAEEAIFLYLMKIKDLESFTEKDKDFIKEMTQKWVKEAERK